MNQDWIEITCSAIFFLASSGTGSLWVSQNVANFGSSFWAKLLDLNKIESKNKKKIKKKSNLLAASLNWRCSSFKWDPTVEKNL